MCAKSPLCDDDADESSFGLKIVWQEPSKRWNNLICFYLLLVSKQRYLTGHILPIPRSRVTASLAQERKCIHTNAHMQRTRHNRPSWLSSQQNTAFSSSSNLTRRKPPFCCCWVLTTSLAHGLLTCIMGDVKSCGLVGFNRSDAVCKFMTTPNNHSNIVIFWFLQTGEHYKTIANDC